MSIFNVNQETNWVQYLGGAMIELIPISKTEIDWPTYLHTAKQVLGHSISETIEKRRLELTQPEAFLESVDWILDHTFYGFQILGSRNFFLRLYHHTNEVKISINTTLQPDYLLGLATGTLKQWKNFILECANGDEEADIRMLSNKLQSYFENEGLYKIFTGMTKKPTIGNTFLLEGKNKS
jgi:hypothetical protein